MSEATARKAALLAEVNAGIREVATSSPSDALDWEFFCECGAHDCRETVTLSVDAYGAIRHGGGPVLAASHDLTAVARAERVREAAQELRDSAVALKAHAKRPSARAHGNP